MTLKEAKKNFKDALIKTRYIQKTQGSGQPVIKANHELVIPAGRILQQLEQEPSD